SRRFNVETGRDRRPLRSDSLLQKIVLDRKVSIAQAEWIPKSRAAGIKDIDKREIHPYFAMADQAVAELDRLCELPQIRVERVGQEIIFRVSLEMPTAIFGHVGIIGREGLLSMPLGQNEQRPEESDNSDEASEGRTWISRHPGSTGKT